MENKLTRQEIHNFLNRLLQGESANESVCILKEVIIDYFCFECKNPDVTVEDYIKDIRSIIKNTQSKGVTDKISWIKKVREDSGMGLAEAKYFIEALMEDAQDWESKIKASFPEFNLKNMLTDRIIQKARERLNKIADDYHVTGV